MSATHPVHPTAPEDPAGAASAVEIGCEVPAFSAASTAGPFALHEVRGKILILYFYPKDNTPGCTTQGMDFRDLHAEILAAGAVVWGVSRDALRSHENFRAKYELPFALISDPDEALCQLFGVMKSKTMYGKPVRGIERSTFVIGRDGVLLRAWRAVKVPGHVAEVLAFVRSL